MFEKTAHRTNGETHAINADGSGDIRLAANTYYNASPRWLPDGEKIVYAGQGSGSYYSDNYEIHTMNADGTRQTNISGNSAAELSPDWGVVSAASQATLPNKGKKKDKGKRGGR